ncbi:MAG: hypothetical protein GWN14_17370, partial [candidate division Zixibacteria bacterium]|nr:hypothetical protein [Phycisphaerae bacterium]NIS15498.1 hypothetical protein [candidate division Zixibacteria bacterium]NIW39958.1 hypothetical protein [candidate division Zixibacteria bacterium]NIX57637.1 hypothetical protein [candidate division Zixibacteria bacterium]
MEDEMTIERIAVERVRKDYKLAKDYLIDWHRECLERYKHYRAPGLSKNILKDNQFPVPFTTEQVDQLRADMMDKLWYKNKPCSIFGRNEEDKSDADAKRKFMDYQDEEDSIFEKTDQAVFHCAIYGIAPAVVNFKVEKETRYIQAEVPIELEDGEYATDLEGNLQFQEEEFPQEITVYQGASVE